MKRLVLFGDSLLARISKSELLLLEQKLGHDYDVYNCAVGGWDTNDLIKKAPYVAKLSPDVVVFSVGTNDASHWKQIELAVFKENLRQIFECYKDSRRIFFLPPPGKVEWQPTDKRISQETLKEYYDTARQLCDQHDIEYVDSWNVFMTLIEPDDTFHVDDGVHISDSGYGAVFDEIAEVIKG